MSYLEEFFDKLTYLPNDVNRYLRLIKELEEKNTSKITQLENMQIQFLSLMRNSKDKKQEMKKPEIKTLYENIILLQDECLGISQEKVDVSNQINEQIDEYLIKLDKDIKKFENEINLNNASNQDFNGFEFPRNDYLSNSRKKKKSEIKLSKYKPKKNFNNNNNAIIPDQIITQDLLPGVDWDTAAPLNMEPLESKYCFCKKNLPEEMVGCDNEFCEIEWFHFSCVGLKKKPKDNEKWYCKDCIQLKKNNQIF